MNATGIRPSMVVANLQTGLDLLSSLPLADPRQAEIELNQLLDSLLQTPPAVDVYLNLLEQSRVPLCFVEEELAQHYLNKPLPLSTIEEECFRQVVVTWLKTARAYAHCAQLDGAADDPSRAALILHRCIYYTGMVMVEHHRARRELPPGFWHDLHAHYANVEKQGVATVAVADELDPLGRTTHCTAAFLALLLSELASPYSLSIRDQSLVRRWAKHWSPLLSLHTALPGETLPPFVIDLIQDVGLSSSADCLQTASLRHLDTTRLAVQMNQIRQQLSQRISPAQIGLGEDCTAGQCNRLLAHIASPWSQTHATRKFRRHATSGTARLCVGFEAMHYYISGKEFTQPESGRLYSTQEIESLSTFRHMVDPAQTLQLRQEQLGFTADQWEIINHSANGFRLMRCVTGNKIAHGQLVAICTHDGEHFLLAKTSWLMQEPDESLIAGVATLPGMPQAIAARRTGPEIAHNERFSRAFLLPAVPAVGTEQSLVIPQGWYRTGHFIEIHTDAIRRVKLRHVLDDGPDFERVSFTAT